jgi:chromosome partitioning protein
MSTKTIAVVNHKGGVGKTTTVCSLGSALAELGYRVLLVDLDAQANLTSSLLKEEPERTMYEAINQKKQLPVVRLNGSKNWSIVAASLDLAGAELEIANQLDREYILKDLLEEVEAEYDYILLDCPPSLGLLTINALVAATDVVIPLTAEALPSKGLQKIQDIIEKVRKRLNTKLRLSGILLTRYESSKLSQLVEEALRQNYGEVVYSTRIRKNVRIAEAPLYGVDILEYANDSNGAEDYRALAKELTEK